MSIGGHGRVAVIGAVRRVWVVAILLLSLASSTDARTVPMPHPPSPVVTVKLSEPKLGDRRAPRAVRQVIRADRGLFRACYQRVLNMKPGIAGTVTLTLELGEAGRVKSASSAGFAPEVDACLAWIARRWRFPASVRTGETVTQSIRFTHRVVRQPLGKG